MYMELCDSLAMDLEELAVAVVSPQERKAKQKKCQHPLLNDCILRTCFKYLSLKTVASCRLVSKFWNQAACSYLRQKSLVKFKFAEEIYGFSNVMEACWDSPFQRFSLQIFEHELEHPLVRLLFDRFGSEMTSITFDLHGNSRYAFKPPDPWAFKALLDTLPQIEEIRLYGLPDNILREGRLFTWNSFPRLKTFAFSIYQDKYNGNNKNKNDSNNNNNNNSEELSEPASTEELKSERALIFNIAHAARSIINLEVGAVNSTCIKVLFQEGKFPRLRSFVTLSTCSSLPIESLMHFDTCPQLRRLSLSLDKSSSEQLYQFLSKVPNLRYLKFQGGNVITNDIPVMKSLKELHLFIICTLSMKKMWTKMRNVRVATIVLNSGTLRHHWLERNEDSGVSGEGSSSPVLSPHLQSLQVNHNDVEVATEFLQRIRCSFPSLTRLRIRATSEIIQQIFKYFHQLEELYIDDGSIVSDQDITGIPADYLYSNTEDQDDMNVGRIGPYIGNLKRLKKLYLGSTYITNASMYYGFADLRELTYLSLQEPVELITGPENKRSPITDHIFSLYPLVCHLSYLIRVEIRESKFRSRSSGSSSSCCGGGGRGDEEDPPVILPDEITIIRSLRPHLQLVYVSTGPAQGEEKDIYY